MRLPTAESPALSLSPSNSSSLGAFSSCDLYSLILHLHLLFSAMVNSPADRGSIAAQSLPFSHGQSGADHSPSHPGSARSTRPTPEEPAAVTRDSIDSDTRHNQTADYTNNATSSTPSHLDEPHLSSVTTPTFQFSAHQRSQSRASIAGLHLDIQPISSDPSSPVGPLLVDRLAALDTSSQQHQPCLLYTSPSPRDGLLSRMPSSA